MDLSRELSKTISVVKPVGKTPLWAVEKLKEKHPHLKSKKISYAGRLDPMADGLLILLIGEENKKRKIYDSLSKTYVTQIMLGISTDTYDALGKVENVSKIAPDKKAVLKVLRQYIGIQDQLYPPYSSKPVQGKPLFWWARNDRLSDVKIPSRKIKIMSLSLQKFKKIPFSDLHNQIERRIQKVEGNFRQDEILASWRNAFNKNSTQEFILLNIKLDCSAGTYIRRFAHDLGKSLACGAFCLSIKRTRVGEYVLRDAIRL